MGIHYENLDDVTRGFSLEESALGNHYPSPRLTDEGLANWVPLLEEALRNHDDDWLAREIRTRGYMRNREQYIRQDRTQYRYINIPHAAQQLGEGEFNRYYLRGLCRRAQSEGITHLIVYRGKEVRNPRPESEAKIGTQIAVDALLEALRSNDFVSIEDTLAVPGGPNSGLTARLP